MHKSIVRKVNIMIDIILITIVIAIATYGIQRTLEKGFDRIEDILLSILSEITHKDESARREK